jgi:hypothetical protein
MPSFWASEGNVVIKEITRRKKIFFMCMQKHGSDKLITIG